MQNVLRHLQRKASGYGIPSHSTVQLYAEVLVQFCRYAGRPPLCIFS